MTAPFAPPPSRLQVTFVIGMIIPDHIQVPSMLRRHHLENLIRRHEREVEYHQERCRLYRGRWKVGVDYERA